MLAQKERDFKVTEVKCPETAARMARRTRRNQRVTRNANAPGARTGWTARMW